MGPWVPDKGMNLEIENASPINKPSSRGSHVTDTEAGYRQDWVTDFGWMAVNLIKILLPSI